MTWEIVLGLITFFGFIITVVSLAVKLTASIAQINEAVKNFNTVVTELKEDNRISCAKLDKRLEGFDRRLDKISDQIGDHETRIKIIEETRKAG